jgi:translation initiation factor 3 subunit C
MDDEIQILYRRTEIQIGLSAFRNGLYEDCYYFLDNKHSEKDILNKIQDHMKIPNDLVETFYLISAMIINLPNIVTNKKITCRKLYSMMKYREHSQLKTPPQSISDHILAATRSLVKGKWEKTIDIIFKLSSWKSVNNNLSIKNKLEEEIKKVALYSYIVTYRSLYINIHVNFLSKKFELSTQQTISIISNLIINKIINASLNPVSKIIDIKPSNSKLQNICVQISDKLSKLVNNNELDLNIH